MDTLRQAGFSGQSLQTAYAIAMAESGGNAKAFNGNQRTGDRSYGLFQINMLGGMGPERRKQFGLSSNDNLYDPVTNAKVAYKMSKGGTDWTAWSTYNNDTYRQYLGQYSDSGLSTANAPTASPTPGDVTGSGLGQDFAPASQDFAPGSQDFAQPVQQAAPQPAADGGMGSTSAPRAGNLAGSTFRDKVISAAMGFLGTRYSWGGGTKSGTSYGVAGAKYDGRGINGLDCSGLMLAAFGLAGYDLPRIARQQLATGQQAPINSLRPGDVIGYGDGYHIALYIGDGQVVDALPGKGVTVRKIGAWEAREGFGVRLHLPGD
jgi:cell wall-associated NlpC family hydrolase